MHRSLRLLSSNPPQPSTEKVTKPKTAVLMLNMGGPQTVDQVENYLVRIMTDTDMIQLPVQR